MEIYLNSAKREKIVLKKLPVKIDHRIYYYKMQLSTFIKIYSNPRKKVSLEN